MKQLAPSIAHDRKAKEAFGGEARYSLCRVVPCDAASASSYCEKCDSRTLTVRLRLRQLSSVEKHVSRWAS